MYIKLKNLIVTVLLATSLKAIWNENQLNYSIAPVDDSWLVAFSYLHSTHQISMRLSPNESSSAFSQELWLWVILAVGVLGGQQSLFSDTKKPLHDPVCEIKSKKLFRKVKA
jgi:hypothetical protein